MSREVNINEGIYRFLDIDSLGFPIDSYYYKDKAETSIWFKGKEGVEPVDFLRDYVFNVKNKELFNKKFEESVSGDGDEAKKNYALKSSSLCALLFFFNVSEDKPLYYDGIKYTKAYFELKNKVVTLPSNMDVVLVGTKNKKDDSILFIESKFSEFIGAKSYPLEKTYTKEPYRHLFYNDAYKYDEQKVFQYGLKQLVTHYIGIKNFLTNKLDDYKEKMSKAYHGKIGDRIDLYKKYDRAGFLEIVFKMDGEEDYDTYLQETEKVFETLKKEKQNDLLDLNIYGTITYQDFFAGKNKDILDNKTKEYYRIK